MVATPRPLSTENRTLHTQRLTPHIAPLLYRFTPGKTRGGSRRCCCTCWGAGGVWIYFPYPALFCCLATGSAAGPGYDFRPFPQPFLARALSSPAPWPPPLLTREQKHDKKNRQMRKPYSWHLPSFAQSFACIFPQNILYLESIQRHSAAAWRKKPVCWNWQTRWTQNPLVAIPCGFDPRHRHQTNIIRTFFR